MFRLSESSILRSAAHLGIAVAAVAMVGIRVPTASAEPVTVSQPLKKSASFIRFGVDSPSPTLKMNGTFTKFGGTLQLDPRDVTKSKVNLSLDLQSVQLQPDQILQAVFLQTALAQLKPPQTSFISDTIEKIRGQEFLISGTYTWRGKTKKTSFPVEIVRSSPSLSEVRVLLNGVAKDGKTPPELAQIGGLGNAQGSKGWAKATFVFTNG